MGGKIKGLGQKRYFSEGIHTILPQNRAETSSIIN